MNQLTDGGHGIRHNLQFILQLFDFRLAGLTRLPLTLMSMLRNWEEWKHNFSQQYNKTKVKIIADGRAFAVQPKFPNTQHLG